MMKNQSLILLLLFIFSSPIFSQNATFMRTYGGAEYDDIRSIVATDDGCFVFTGLCKSADDPEGDMYLTKINSAGAVLWQKFYGLEEEDGGNALIATRDGGFLISGHTAKSYGIACDGYIVKTDADGNQEWKWFVGRAFDDVCDGVVQSEEGDFYFTGRIEDSETREFDVLLVKISEAGELIFTKNIAGDQNEFGYRITESSDGNLLIAGYQQGINTQADDAYILKVDKSGNVIWERSFGTEVNDRISSIIALEDGSCLVSGGTNTFGVNAYEKMFVAKLRADGNLDSHQFLLENEGTGYLFDAAKKSENGFSFFGILEKEDMTYGQPVLIKTDFELNVLEKRIVVTSISAEALSGVIGIDGSYFLAGKTNLETETPNSFVARLDDYDTQTKNIILAPFQLFPNPFEEFTYLKIENSPFSKTISFYNLVGQLVRTELFEGDEIFIYKNNLEAGNYVFKIENEAGDLITSGKLSIK